MTDKWHIGTSGWSYDHWKGVFYPDGPDLEFYAEHFDCVELNASFYHLPQHKTILKWKNETPEHFRFCPKLSRYITHQKKLNDVEKPFRRFIERLRPMKEKIGPVLVQFPEQVKFDNPNAERFFKLIRQFWSWEFAIEARDGSWMNEEALALLKEYGLSWVIADSGGEFPKLEGVSSDSVYLRFHGPKKVYASKYEKSALDEVARKVKRWSDEGKEVWVFFNNDHQGYAVENAEFLKKRMREP